jgi:hypothetical protein
MQILTAKMRAAMVIQELLLKNTGNDNICT